ncbi:MAG: DNA polymerase III subunit chi [Hydrogenophilaceae bacterium]|jgi:DNA polymerase-3 subunit chi|nr:DNA polymerase III subunit chi [Hydrogenophilaceae bacterium]
MAELWFYHLERSELEQALAPLLEKCLQRGWRALVRGSVEERLEALDDALWTWRDDSFIPHAKDHTAPERQPVLLTTKDGNPNGAQALFLIDDAEPGDLSGFARACLLFDGRDEAALKAARARWKIAKDQGHDVSYWKQDARGKWEKQQ